MAYPDEMRPGAAMGDLHRAQSSALRDEPKRHVLGAANECDLELRATGARTQLRAVVAAVVIRLLRGDLTGAVPERKMGARGGMLE